MDNKKIVSQAKKLITLCSSAKIKRKKETDLVKEMYSRFYDLSDIEEGSVEYFGAEMFQATNNLIQRAKFPEFTFEGVGYNNLTLQQAQLKEKLVGAGIVDIMHKAELPNAYSGTDGAQFDSFLTGRGYITLQRTKNKKKPVKYISLPEEYIFVDPRANDIHGSAKDKNATELAIVIPYDVDKAAAMYPEIAEKQIYGRVAKLDNDDTTYTDEQKAEQSERNIVEIMHYYNINTGVYAVIAGSEYYVLSIEEGANYPYKVDGEDTIPVFSFKCFPKTEGFYSPGIGTAIARTVAMLEEIQRANMKQIKDAAYSHTMVNVPEGHKESFFESLLDADRLRSNNDRAWMVNEYDAHDPNSTGISVQNIQSTFNTDLINLGDQLLQRKLTRFGLKLDGNSNDGAKTATQILSEVKSQNLLLEQFGEFNALEIKRMFGATLEAIKGISKSNKTIVSLRALKDPALSNAIGSDFTFGVVAEELRTYHYFPHFNLRTGYLPSEELHRQEILELMPYIAPGTRAHAELIVEFAKTRGKDIPIESIMGSPAPQPQQSPEGELTDINPQSSDLLNTA